MQSMLILYLQRLRRLIFMKSVWILVLELQCMAKIQMWWIQTAMSLLVLAQLVTWLHLHKFITITTITSLDNLHSSRYQLLSPLIRNITSIITTITSHRSIWQLPKSWTWQTITTSIQVQRVTTMGVVAAEVSSHLRQPLITRRKDLQALGEAAVGSLAERRLSSRA